MKTISTVLFAAAMSIPLVTAGEAQNVPHHAPRAHHRRITLGDFSATAQTQAPAGLDQADGSNAGGGR